MSISLKVKRNSYYLPMSSILRHAIYYYLDRMKISIVNLSASHELDG